MAKYRVITLAMSVKNNRIAQFDEIVDDSELTINPSELIKEGFIQKVESDDEKIAVEEIEVKVEELTETKTEIQDEELKPQTAKDKPKAKDKAKAKLALKK